MIEKVTLSVFFEGTIWSIKLPDTLLFSALESCKGTKIETMEQIKQHPNETHFKMGFDGCSKVTGNFGVLYGAGIDEQVLEVVNIVKDLIKSGKRVKLNAAGLSRGGIASLLLAKHLGSIDLNHLETNLLLLDPVPGNLPCTAYVDYFGLSWTSQMLNHSASKNLKYVEAIYPYVEVGDDTGTNVDWLLGKFHVPIRPTYPSHCEVREEVVLGAHSKAFEHEEKEHSKDIKLYDEKVTPLVRKLSKMIIYTFLYKVGSLTLSNEENHEITEIIQGYEKNREQWTTNLQDIITQIIPKSREMHSEDESKITVTNTARFLNKTHRDLVDKTLTSPDDLCLKVEPERVYKPINKEPLTKELLLSVIKIFPSLTKNKNSLLGKISTALTALKDFNQEQLSCILRDIILIALQRDSSFGFFTVNSDAVLINALNSPEFQPIRVHLTLSDKSITFSDLSDFALARDDAGHFDTYQEEENLKILEHEPGDDVFGVLLQ